MPADRSSGASVSSAIFIGPISTQQYPTFSQLSQGPAPRRRFNSRIARGHWSLTCFDLGR